MTVDYERVANGIAEMLNKGLLCNAPPNSNFKVVHYMDYTDGAERFDLVNELSNHIYIYKLIGSYSSTRQGAAESLVKKFVNSHLRENETWLIMKLQLNGLI